MFVFPTGGEILYMAERWNWLKGRKGVSLNSASKGQPGSERWNEKEEN